MISRNEISGCDRSLRDAGCTDYPNDCLRFITTSASHGFLNFLTHATSCVTLSKFVLCARSIHTILCIEEKMFLHAVHSERTSYSLSSSTDKEEEETNSIRILSFFQKGFLEKSCEAAIKVESLAGIAGTSSVSPGTYCFVRFFRSVRAQLC